MDITCNPILDLIKDNKQYLINEKLYLVNYNNILIKDNLIKLKNDGMSIDLGSIVKGYATDLIVDILDKNNIDNAIIDLGGNIYVKGTKNYKVGIQDPFNKDKIIGYIILNNKSVVTSGNYERGNHIINPHTGLIVNNNLKSVSIIADKSIDAEGLSTAYYIKGIPLNQNTNDSINAIYIDNNRNVYLTGIVKDIFILTNKKFKVKELL